MTALTRWDPLREAPSLRDAMNQLFEQAVMGLRFASLPTGVGAPLNIAEAEGRYYCQVALPGISPDAIELTVRQNTLTLHATLPETLPEQVRKNATYLVREFGAGEFSRSVTFPKDVEGNQIAAHYDRGILTVEVPLAKHAQPQRIAIRDAAAEAEPALTPATVVEDRGPAREPAQVN